MLNDFLIFIAPVLMIGIAMFLSFVVSVKDEAVRYDLESDDNGK